MAKMEEFMAIHTADGESGDILGKYMYYSLPKLIVKADHVREICGQIDFPITVNENISLTDAFRSATGEIHDRIEKIVDGELRVCRVYCRDNKRVAADVVSRELVEETLYETTNAYRKLANFTLDKSSGEMVLSDVEYSSTLDILGYFSEADRLFRLYQECVGSRSIETMAEKNITGMHAVGINTRGHHYFVPKAYMHQIELLEEFMELIGQKNLFSYENGRDSKYISINSMYVADDAKQRGKMSREFYQDIGREIEEYQKRIVRLIQSGNSSQRILDRWEAKIQSLEDKKREYEELLRQDLSGIDEEFTLLRDMCNQFRLSVRRSQALSTAA